MTILILPGLGGSDIGHWQDHWARELPDARIVQQRDWNAPDVDAWTTTALEAIAAAPGAILVGHSLGAVTIAHLAARKHHLPVTGALLVAPADVDRGGQTFEPVRPFGPMPIAPLPFPAIVVASRTDPYMSFDRAQVLANMWDARLVDAGDAGHINIASGHGRWVEGRALLDPLLARQRLLVRTSPFAAQAAGKRLRRAG